MTYAPGDPPVTEHVRVRREQRHVRLTCPVCGKRGVHLDLWNAFRHAKPWCRACQQVTYFVTWDIDAEDAITARLAIGYWPGDQWAENPWYETRRHR